MPYRIQVTVSSGLNYRTKPSTQLGEKKGVYPKGTILDCDTKTKTGNETWYHITNNNYWVCGYKPSDGWYIKGLDSSNSSSPTEITYKPKKPKSNNPNSNSGYGEFSVDEYTDKFEFSGNVNGVNVDSKSNKDAKTFSSIHIPNSEPDNYRIDTTWLNEYLKIIKHNLNIAVSGDNIIHELFNNFNRYKVEYPDINLDKTFAFVFITRPDLNLMESTSKKSPLHSQVANDPLCYYLYHTRPEILTSLCKNHTYGHDFNTFLSNAASSFEVSDEYIKTGDSGETLTGHKISFGKSNIDSKTSGNFSINYKDDRELNIYKMHKIWVDYISNVYRGIWVPKNSYIDDKILDYAVSVYYILCAEDLETVIFWSKYYGVFPTNIPSSSLSWSKGSIVKSPEYSITYQYSFKEDFNPLSLAEFNINTNNGNFIYKKIYEPDLKSTGRSFSGAPFIDTVDARGQYLYKLRFRKEII